MSIISSRMAREARTVRVMISLYCRRHHRKGGLCSGCTELTDYALERLAKCPFQEGKTACVRCPVHCYRPEMREKIRAVMRYAGPRMMYRHPALALFHFVDKARKVPVRPVPETER
jgi:predicted amidophosphoribosyltransferase